MGKEGDEVGVDLVGATDGDLGHVVAGDGCIDDGPY